MSARKIRGHWFVDLRYGGRRFRKRSPDDSRAGAVAYEATLRGRLSRGEPLVPPPPKPPPPRFQAFAWRWFHTYVETNNKLSEQKAKYLMLRKHLVPSFGPLPLDRIDSLRIEQFKAVRLRSGLSPKTVNNIIAVLAKCLRTAEDWGELERVPKMKPLRVEPPGFDYLSIAEAERLIAAVPDEPWHAMVLVALRTGLRIGELIGLEWGDVNLDNGILTVRRSVFGRHIVSPKSNRIRHIPLTDKAYRTLVEIRQPTGPVFGRVGGVRLNDQLARRTLRRFCIQANLRPIGWHVLRHTFASHLAMSGVSIKVIQELLGHSDVRTTMRYAHLGPSSLHDAVQLLDTPDGFRELLGHSVGNALTAVASQNGEMPRVTGHS